MAHKITAQDVKNMGWPNMTDEQITHDLQKRGIKGKIEKILGKRTICLPDPGTNELTNLIPLE
ncbi:hypothetical protein HGO34_25860 [Agrobacterium vitis]|uniref:Uncharacterized protein n=1 Tax=Agrobacterium vitis TaxID=373 RepID=A0AAE4WIH7_AGRVI|nr:hypothetical protein [Agrobacterium vitis]MCF1497084.1 hypothetical protein [Allorhizobium sp. Av2]MCM2443131.1 hypothetical protein [Agrobacterium vitis]MUZ60740.1 hypothetical protein [Agrobacterium vitis]MVA68927.1 hypothetical protein [Agrobacterium vitis]MVA90047.1 hypothetical protein [Agrobacterium vitis]